MKKRLTAIVLVLMLVVSGFTVPTSVNAKVKEPFFDMVGINTSEKVINNVSFEDKAEQMGALVYESEEQSFPTRFDLRDYGLVTPIKNVGQYALNGEFAVCAALESNAIMMGLAKNDIDLSEYHLAYFTRQIVDGQDEMIEGEGMDSGKEWYYATGMYFMNTSTLMKGYGPVSEEVCPYENIEKPLTIEYATKYNLFDFNGVYAVPANDINAAKELITRNGAAVTQVNVSSWSDEKFYNRETKAAYLPKWNDTYYMPDCAMVIVGWDDNYSKENFVTQPKGDGAWILRGCWGTTTGFEGYYYISYYDAAFNEYELISSLTLSPLHSTDYAYQYDGGPAIGGDANISAVALTFTAKEDQTLTAVAIYPSVHFEEPFVATTGSIKVYTDVIDNKKIEDGKCIYTQKIVINSTGYRKEEFDRGVNLDKGKKYWIVVNFDNPIYYQVDFTYSDWGGSKVVGTAHPGETFVKAAGGAWIDYVDAEPDYPANACIKAFVRTGHNQEVIHRDHILDEPTFYLLNNEEAKVTVTWKPVKNADGYKIYRKIKGVEKNFSLLATVDAATSKYYDTGLTLGADYTYKVVPFAGSYEGNSAEKTIRATIAAPWLTKLENTKKGEVKISIQKVKDAKSYSVYRLVNGTYQWLGSVDAKKSNTYVDKFNSKYGAYATGATYSYKLTVKRGDRTSALSAAKSITVNK